MGKSNDVLMAVLLSAAVFPGAGQFRNRDVPKGTLFLGATLALLVLISARVFGEVSPLLTQPPDLALLVPLVERAVATALSGPGTVYSIGLVLVWLYSILDAFFVARSRR